MYSSRWVFARTDAAAMSANFPSPLTMQAKGMPASGLKRLPSTARNCGPGIEPPRGEVHPLDRGIENVDLVDAGGRDLLDGPGYRFAFDDRP